MLMLLTESLAQTQHITVRFMSFTCTPVHVTNAFLHTNSPSWALLNDHDGNANVELQHQDSREGNPESEIMLYAPKHHPIPGGLSHP